MNIFQGSKVLLQLTYYNTLSMQDNEKYAGRWTFYLFDCALCILIIKHNNVKRGGINGNEG